MQNETRFPTWTVLRMLDPPSPIEDAARLRSLVAFAPFAPFTPFASIATIPVQTAHCQQR